MTGPILFIIVGIAYILFAVAVAHLATFKVIDKGWSFGAQSAVLIGTFVALTVPALMIVVWWVSRQ